MGQSMLESCQLNCQKMGPRPITRTRSQLYFNNLTSMLPFHDDKQNSLLRSVSTMNKNNHFLTELQDVPIEYVEYVNALFHKKIKFEDTIFGRNLDNGSREEGEGPEWERLSDMTPSAAIIYQRMYQGKKSKVLKLLELLEENLPVCLEEIKPIYIDKVGLAVVRLWINGVKEEIVIDDYVPTLNLRYYVKERAWHFLVEKAFAKVLGCYVFIEDFTLPELFLDLTGLPFQITRDSNGSWANRDSSLRVKQGSARLPNFRDIIDVSNVYYLNSGLGTGEMYCVRCLPQYALQSTPIAPSKQTSVFRLKVLTQDKISVRISALNPKYEPVELAASRQSLPSLQLFREVHDGTLVTTNIQSTIIGNNIYLGEAYLKFNQGNYVLSVGPSPRRTTLVVYSGPGVTVREVTSKQSNHHILKQMEGQRQANCQDREEKPFTATTIQH